MKMPQIVKSIVLLLVVGCAYAQAPPPPAPEPKDARHVSFVTCPIFRDAASQCWLAEHDGDVYYIGGYRMGSPPQLRHKVLVEGTIVEGPRSCGGILVQPVHVSTLQELDNNCDTVLPDNGSLPSEPSRFDVPPEILNLIGVELPMPKGPFADKDFVVGFDYNNTFLNQLNQQAVELAAKYAIASKAKHVEITGFAAKVLLENGQVLQEPLALANERSRAILRAFTALGVSPSVLKVNRPNYVTSADGVHDWQNRKVIVSVSGVTR